MSHALAILFLFLTGVALVWTVVAIFRSIVAVAESGRVVATSARTRALEDEKNALFRSIRDIELERDLGRISKDDFDALNADLRTRAKEVIATLDADLAPHLAAAERAIGAVLPASLADLPAKGPAPAPLASEPETPTPPSAPSSRVTCAACQAPNDLDAAFCKKCGAKMSERAAP